MRVVRWRVGLAVFALVVTATACADERILLERQSPYQPIVVNETDEGLRILRFGRGGARQSVVKPGDPDHLELPYARAVPVAFAYVPDPRSMLVIGLGGATLPMFARKHYPSARIDVVELDPVVVHVARSHFGYREDPHLRTHVGDGRRYVERSRQRYDIVVLDAFGQDSTPFPLVTREFMSAVQRIVASHGILFANIWGPETNPMYHATVRTMRDVFAHIVVVEVAGAGNKLIVAHDGPQTLGRDEVITRARMLNRRLALRFDLADIVESGFRPLGNDGVNASVLRDADDPARRVKVAP